MNAFKIFLSCVVIFFPGCSPFHPRAGKFFFSSNTSLVEAAQENLRIVVKQLSSRETFREFGVQVITEGYHAFSLEISNESENIFALRPSYISLPLTSGKRIARLVHWKTSTWASCGLVACTFFWWPGIPLLVIPASWSMREFNKRTTKSLEKHTLCGDESIEILPHERVRKFFFIHETAITEPLEIGFFCRETKKFVRFRLS